MKKQKIADVSESIAGQIKQLRNEQGVSQEDLGERMGVSQQQVAKLESGEANPSVDTLMKVAEAFDLDVVFTFKPQHGQRYE